MLFQNIKKSRNFFLKYIFECLVEHLKLSLSGWVWESSNIAKGDDKWKESQHETRKSVLRQLENSNYQNMV